MKLFQRTFLKEIFLNSFISFFLLVAITSTILTSIHIHREINISIWLFYLMAKTATFLPIFLPLSFLLAACLITFKKRKNLEFLALFTSGVSLKRFTSPLLVFSFVLSTILIFNDHFFLSKARNLISELKPMLVSHKKRMNKEKISILNLKDAKLIYHDYDKEEKIIRDLFVIESPKKLWHFESYSLKEQKAYAVDLIEEKEEELTRTAFFIEKPFALDPQLISFSQITIDKVNLKTLVSLFQKPFFQERKKELILLQIHQKILFILFPFLLTFLIVSFLLKSFIRGFLLQASALFLLFFLFYFGVYLLSSLAEVGVISPNMLYGIFFCYLLISIRPGYSLRQR